jgi:hypothetical protein
MGWDSTSSNTIEGCVRAYTPHDATFSNSMLLCVFRCAVRSSFLFVSPSSVASVHGPPVIYAPCQRHKREVSTPSTHLARGIQKVSAPSTHLARGIHEVSAPSTHLARGIHEVSAPSLVVGSDGLTAQLLPVIACPRSSHNQQIYRMGGLLHHKLGDDRRTISGRTLWHHSLDLTSQHGGVRISLSHARPTLLLRRASDGPTEWGDYRPAWKVPARDGWIPRGHSWDDRALRVHLDLRVVGQWLWVRT